MQENKPQKHLEEKVDLIKSVVRNTLEELEAVDYEINRLQKKKASLKRDLVDLKEGRLDRIEERQDLDADSKSASVFTVRKKIIVGGESNPWYLPFMVEFRSGQVKVSEVAVKELDINNSMTKINASGSYKLNSGKVTFL